MSSTETGGKILALLAAGQSSRFGEQDKLGAILKGKMLGVHAAEALHRLPFDRKIVIAAADNQSCWKDWKRLGYEILVNERAKDGQSTSVALAAETAQSGEFSALCICLADMPFVSADHVTALVSQFDIFGQTEIFASARDGKPLPPAIFPANAFAALEKLKGDQGARKLLQGANTILVDADVLMDIDTPELLQQFNDQTDLQCP